MGGTDRGPDESISYGRARRWAGGGLFVLGAVLLLLEPLTHIHPDPAELGLIFGTGSLLLGVEIGRAFLR